MKRTGKHKDHTAATEGKIRKAAKVILHRWADWMQKKTGRMSKATLLIMLTVLVICSAIYNFSILTNLGKQEKLPVIAIPAPIVMLPVDTGTVDLASQMTRISSFRRYMDSLAQSAEGKILHDSIRKRHPGLLDSIKMLEKIYRNN